MAATSGARASRSDMRASSGVSWVLPIREYWENAVRGAGFTAYDTRWIEPCLRPMRCPDAQRNTGLEFPN